MNTELIISKYKDAVLDTAAIAAAARIANNFPMSGLRAMGMSQALLFGASICTDDKARAVMERMAAASMAVAASTASNLIFAGAAQPGLPQLPTPPAVQDMPPFTPTPMQEIMAPKRMPTPDEILNLVQEEYANAMAEASAFSNPKYVMFNEQGAHIGTKVTDNKAAAAAIRKVGLVEVKVGKKAYYVEALRKDFHCAKVPNPQPVKVVPALPTYAGFTNTTTKYNIGGKRGTVEAAKVHAKINERFNLQENKLTPGEPLVVPHEHVPASIQVVDTTATVVAPLPQTTTAAKPAPAAEPKPTPVNAPPASASGDVSGPWPKSAVKQPNGTYLCPRCNKPVKRKTLNEWRPAALPEGSVRTKEYDDAIIWGASTMCAECNRALDLIVAQAMKQSTTATAVPAAAKSAKSATPPVATTTEVDKLEEAHAFAREVAKLDKELSENTEAYVKTCSEVEDLEKNLRKEASVMALLGDAAPDSDKKAFEQMRFNVQSARLLCRTLEEKEASLTRTRLGIIAGVPVETAKAPAAKAVAPIKTLPLDKRITPPVGTSMAQALGNAKKMKRNSGGKA